MNNKQSLKDISPTTQAILLAIETVESTPEIISQEKTSLDTQNTDLNKDSWEKKKYYTSVPSFVFHGIASLVLLCMSIHSASADSIFAAALFDVAEEISVWETDSALVRLVDTYNQPVEGEYFKIMTDTDAVLVDQKSFRTNKHGEMLFEISRIQNGSYCIQIVDPIYEEVYEEKCFLQKLDTKRSITSFLMADSFSSDDTLLSGSEKASQQLSDFDMRSFPEVVYRGEPVGIEIAALDSEGSVLSNYNGKIHFSVMDQEGNIFDDVSLPADTRFALASKGVQSFDLSINFHKEGVYTLVVNDVEKPSVQTEITDIRVQTRPLSTDMDTSSEKPRILYPEDGVVLSQTDIEVYGDNITPYADVLIYDGRKKIAEIESDRGGEFRYIFQDMKEWTHELTAIYMDEDGIPSEVSDIVSFRIDMSLPIFTDIEVTDTHIYSGEKFTFSFDTTGKVEKAIAFINDDEYLLTQDKKDKSRYIFSENMDLDLGEYPIEIDLYDIKLDSVHYTLPITLFIDEKEEVSSAVMTPSNTSDGDTTSNLDIQKFLDSIRKDADEVDTFVYIPSAVASVQVQADADGSRAFLSWTPATDDEQVVSYRIYYGTDKKFLPYTSQTSDARTSWYVDNLIPGTEYVFKVVAVDNRGNEGKVIQNSYTSIQLPLLIAGVDYPFEHRVQGGETLSSIAAQYHVALSSLASDNGVSDKDRVFPGQVLSIPLENQVDITEVELPKQTPNTGPEDWMLWIIVLLSLDVSLRLYSMKKS